MVVLFFDYIDKMADRVKSVDVSMVNLIVIPRINNLYKYFQSRKYMAVGCWTFMSAKAILLFC